MPNTGDIFTQIKLILWECMAKISFFSNYIYLRNNIAKTFKYVTIAQRDVLK